MEVVLLLYADRNLQVLFRFPFPLGNPTIVILTFFLVESNSSVLGYCENTLAYL